MNVMQDYLKKHKIDKLKSMKSQEQYTWKKHDIIKNKWRKIKDKNLDKKWYAIIIVEVLYIWYEMILGSIRDKCLIQFSPITLLERSEKFLDLLVLFSGKMIILIISQKKLILIMVCLASSMGRPTSE